MSKCETQLIEYSEYEKVLNALKVAQEGLEACRDTRYFNPVADAWQPSVVQFTCRDYLKKIKEILK